MSWSDWPRVKFDHESALTMSAVPPPPPLADDVLGKALVAMLGKVLKDGCTAEVRDAWAKAFGEITAIMQSKA